MKKYFRALGLMVAAAFTLTNCAEQIDAPVESAKVPFEIIASTVETKTAAGDNLSTVWTEGDALNVFHVFAGNEDYQNDGKFELTGVNTFKGELSGTFEDEDCYNWYALYPYDKNVTTPANTGDKGYVTVGSTSSVAQVQTGNNSMSHIAGSNYPLAGVAEDIEYYAGEPLEISMSHLSSLLEVVVKNETGKDLTVESVSFTGTEDVVGTYFIDFTGNAPVFKESGKNYVANTAKLEVEEGEAIPSGQSAKFYLAIKPFTATGEISLAVNNIAKPKTVNNVTFAPGTIKTLNYTMKASDFLETSDIADAIKVEDNVIVQIEGLVVARYARGFLVKDDTGAMLVYTNSTPEQVVGDKVNVTGPKATYAGLSQIKTPTIEVLSQNNAVTHPAPIVLDGAGLDAQLTATSVSYVQFTGKLAVSGSYYNVTVAGASTAQGSISYPESSLGLSDMNGKTIKVSGYFIGVSSNKYVNLMVVAVEEIPTVADPVIECTENGNVTITCATEGATVYYTTDGTDPSATNGTAYAGEFQVTSGTTVKAVGVKAGYADSKIVSKTYSVTSSAEAWVLVTDVSSLAVNDQIVIAAKDENYAMSTNQKSNNRDVAEVVKNGDKITFGDDVQIIVLEQGTKENTFAFKTDAGYLYAASSKSNHLKSQSGKNDNASWLITIESNGIATIKAQGTNTRNWMRFNTSSNPKLFACYESGQKDIVIYKKN